jgi:hypothetical protein
VIVAISVAACASRARECPEDALPWPGQPEPASAIPKYAECSCPLAKRLAWLDSADPVADATAAAEREDFRVRSAAEGPGSVAPGLHCWEQRKLLGEVFIEGSSDGIQCYEHDRLNFVAREYARRYNETIIRLFEREGGQKLCFRKN